ncbi:hypothetical protein FQR65_LT03294 [Abscondita terminalis]|nr:hypothetical protein FQR65_LT03294 [Abscondita terminalis]
MISNLKKRLGEINQLSEGNNNNNEITNDARPEEVSLNNNNVELGISIPSKLIKDCTQEVGNAVRRLKDENSLRIAGVDRGAVKNRFSFHQDVDEALNSLLWQPYEYQNKQISEDDSSVSSFSSCCSLSSFDLERTHNNGIVQSPRYGNGADLHLTIEMVNNLTCCGNQLNQSKEAKGPRDFLATSSPTRLLSNVSACEQQDEILTCSCYGSKCNEFTSTPGSMRVEISNSLTDGPSVYNNNNKSDKDNAARSVSSVNLTHQNAAAGGESSGGAVQQRHSQVPALSATTTSYINGYQRSVSSDMIPSNLNSIVSANVVGLPNHPRHASVPSSTTQSRNSTGNGFIFPNHPRNASEPSAMIQQPVVINHSRNGSTPSAIASNNPIRNVGVATPARTSNVTVNQNSNISCANIVSILSHHRHSSHVNSGEIPMLGGNTLRSSSVPKAAETTNTLNISTNTQQRIPINVNVSAVDVNFYRAVPVTVVSNVPTIQCVNNTTEIGNNVSNVNIVQAMTSATTSTSQQHVRRTQNAVTGTTQVTVHNSENTPTPPPPAQLESRTRTFTSTEAQTDDSSTTPPVRNTDRAVTREQRRRERRERRHLRRVNNASHQHASNPRGATWNSNNNNNNDRLPDLLNNHLPPPYSPNHGNPPSSNGPVVSSGLVHNTLIPGTIVPNNIVPSGVVASHVVPFHPPVGQVPLVQGGGAVSVPVPAPSGFRFPFPTAGFRRSRYSEEPPKSCCGLLAWKPGSLRWFIALIAVVAVCCVLVGTALGAMRPAGRDHLTVSLLMIGVGIVLVTVSGVAWRLTSHDSSTCRAMLGLGSTESVDVCPRRFVPRLPPSYGRPHHPYAAMIYPEFQYRPPPPSYQASMQEYRLRLLLLDRGHTPQIQAGVQNGPSPPPTYRSYAGSLLRAPLSSRRDPSQSEYSFPPSYRSQTGSTRPAAVDFQTNVIIHSREQSLSLSESNHGGSIINGVSILNNNDEDIALDNITIDSFKMAPESEINPVKMLLKSGSELDNIKDGNLVTIVQTSDNSPVIVTVSGCSQTNTGSSVQITEIPSEMEILAHL